MAFLFPKLIALLHYEDFLLPIILPLVFLEDFLTESLPADMVRLPEFLAKLFFHFLFLFDNFFGTFSFSRASDKAIAIACL
jgi:hypothetical protein